MKRTLGLFVVAACGHSSSVQAPSNVDSPTLVTDTPITPADADCEGGLIEDQAAGNADRYSFEASEGHVGYKNGAGAIVIPPLLRMGYEFKKSGIAAAVDGDGTMVFIDKSGKRIAQAYAFDNGPDYFAEGFARIVGTDGKIGFISDRGIIPAALAPQFDRANIFCHGKVEVVVGDKLYSVDRAGVRTEIGQAPPPSDPCGD